MSKLTSSFSARRFTPYVQGGLIRAYKVMGIVALTGILVGLICFVTVNLFYLVNRGWVRPVALSPTHSSVLSAMATLSSESAQRDELMSEREQLKAELAGIEQILQLNDQFQKEFETAARATPAGAKGSEVYEAMVARRAYGESVVERERSGARKLVIARRIERLDASIARYDKLIHEIQSSAYITATERKVTVAFVPYENLDNVEAGMPIYACRWGLVLCREVGVVRTQLSGEVTDSHPQSGNSMRGVMVEINLDDREAAGEKALFVGKKPFWIL
jgi:hypothetical protein